MLTGFVINARDYVGSIIFPGKKKVVIGEQDALTDAEADKICDDIKKLGWKFAKE
jgi:hypothetical protein